MDSQEYSTQENNFDLNKNRIQVNVVERQKSAELLSINTVETIVGKGSSWTTLAYQLLAFLFLNKTKSYTEYYIPIGMLKSLITQIF